MTATTIDEVTALQPVANPAPQPLALQPQATDQGAVMLRMIEAAVMRPDFDAAKLNALFDVKLRIEADEARKAFVAAKAAFKAEPIVIKKDRENKQYGSRYTSLGNLLDSVRPYLSKHGLSADFDQDQTEGLVITCRLSHAMGYSETSSFKVPPDTSGQKNPIQQLKSAITYGRAVTFEAVCGLAATDANVDDDGAGTSAAVGAIAEALVDQYLEKLKATTTDEEAAAVWAEGAQAIGATKHAEAYAEFKSCVVAHRTRLKGTAK